MIRFTKPMLPPTEAPVPPFASGNTPVTPVVNGKPVAFVRVPDAGVPSTGVVRVGLEIVGDVARTTLPDPVVDALDTDVPLPWSNPLTLVDSVMAGAVVGLATVPANPLAETTDAVVTVPAPATDAQLKFVPFQLRYVPAEDGAVTKDVAPTPD